MFTDVEQPGMDYGNDAFQRLCHEAVRSCGSDMAAIERYVAERLQSMDMASRLRIEAEIRDVLIFQGPLPPGSPQN